MAAPAINLDRTRGYLRAADEASRAGRHEEARAALRLAAGECDGAPADAVVVVELAIATAEAAQRRGDSVGAAAAFADAVAADRAADRHDALATVRILRAALAAEAAGDA